MPTLPSILAFALVSLGLAMIPGPNMIYVISRSIGQGRRAGLISLGGVALGYGLYMVGAAVGLAGLFVAVPYAYEAFKLVGAAYLLFVAWQAIRPGGRDPFAARTLRADRPGRLFGMGLVTSILNPKIALMYLSLLPQFVDAGHGSVLVQSLALGSGQIVVNVFVNGAMALGAGAIAGFLARRPTWSMVQRWIVATVLGTMAVRLAAEARR